MYGLCDQSFLDDVHFCCLEVPELAQNIHSFEVYSLPVLRRTFLTLMDWDAI